MQWADASLLDFVEYLLEWSRDKPLFVVTLARPELLEKRPTWGAGHRNFTSLYLEPLSEQAMEELLVGLVPGLPSQLRKQILERAEGVPLYAVETVRMLLDRGLLVQEGSTYQLVGEVETLEVPETLHALIAARLDGLAPDERRLLGDAAVLGKTFTPQALAALSGLEPDRLDELLTGMVRREVLGLQSDPRSPEQGQYTFLQDLLRHVAYETLPKRERREKHLAAAEHLSATLGEEEVAEVVASHLLDAYRLDPEADDSEGLRRQAHDGAAAARAPERLARRLDRGTPLFRAGRRPRRGAARSGRGAASERARWRLRALDIDGASRLFEQRDRPVRVQSATPMRPPVPPVGSPRIVRIASAPTRAGDRAAGAGLRRDRRRRAGRRPRLPAHPPRRDALLRRRISSGRASCTERALDVGEELQLPEHLARGWNLEAILVAPRRPQEARGLFQLALDTDLEHELFQNAAASSTTTSPTPPSGGIGMPSRWRTSSRRSSSGGGSETVRESGSRSSEMTYALAMLGRWDEALARMDEIPDEHLNPTSSSSAAW